MATLIPTHRLGTLALTVPVVYRSLTALVYDEKLSPGARRTLQLAAASAGSLALEALHAVSPALRSGVAVCFVFATIRSKLWQDVHRILAQRLISIAAAAREKPSEKLGKKTECLAASEKEAAMQVIDGEAITESSVLSEINEVDDSACTSTDSGSETELRVSTSPEVDGKQVSSEPVDIKFIPPTAKNVDAHLVRNDQAPEVDGKQVSSEPVDIEFIPPTAKNVGTHFVRSDQALSVAEKARALDAWAENQPKRTTCKAVRFSSDAGGKIEGVRGKSFVYAAGELEEDEFPYGQGAIRAASDVQSRYCDESEDGAGVSAKIKAMEKYLDEAPKYRPAKVASRRRLSVPGFRRKSAAGSGNP